MINNRKLERVARAICRAAGCEVSKSHCNWCENETDPVPCIWEQFTKEAEAAIKAMKGF